MYVKEYLHPEMLYSSPDGRNLITQIQRQVK